jgi:hypothetical protein
MRRQESSIYKCTEKIWMKSHWRPILNQKERSRRLVELCTSALLEEHWECLGAQELCGLFRYSMTTEQYKLLSGPEVLKASAKVGCRGGHFGGGEVWRL